MAGREFQVRRAYGFVFALLASASVAHAQSGTRNGYSAPSQSPAPPQQVQSSRTPASSTQRQMSAPQSSAPQTFGGSSQSFSPTMQGGSGCSTVATLSPTVRQVTSFRATPQFIQPVRVQSFMPASSVSPRSVFRVTPRFAAPVPVQSFRPFIPATRAYVSPSFRPIVRQRPIYVVPSRYGF